jgi:hypothetical protein
VYAAVVVATFPPNFALKWQYVTAKTFREERACGKQKTADTRDQINIKKLNKITNQIKSNQMK